MKVLVTGGTGFIGSHLVERLVKRGDDVTCLVRNGSSQRWLAGIRGNSLLHVRKELEHVGMYERIYHLAGILGNPKVDLTDYIKVHVEMPYEITRQMRRGQHFIYMSSAWIYAAEKAYELTKLSGEYVVKASCEVRGVDWSIIRPGFVYGERDMHLLNMFRVIKWLGPLVPVIGGGENKVCPTYVGDVIHLLMNINPGITNICGHPIKMRQFLWFLADMLQRPRSRLTVKWVPNILHLREMCKWDFFTRERIFPSDVRDEDMTPLLLGVTNTVKWYREHRYL